MSDSEEDAHERMCASDSEDDGDDAQPDNFGRYTIHPDLGEDVAPLLFRKFRTDSSEVPSFVRAPKGYAITEAHLQGPYTEREKILVGMLEVACQRVLETNC